MRRVGHAVVHAKTGGMSREEWLVARASGIGGSDIAQIAGISKWGNALKVYLSKVEPLAQNDQSEAAEIGSEIEDGREEVERPIWEQRLPFMAQKVVDLGYDLPRPYGVKLLYSSIDQAQNLDNLLVGFSGGEKEPFEFVTFENARSQSDSPQLIGDLWLLPFLNLFGFEKIRAFDRAILLI